MGKTIHSREREIILKVLDFFEREKEVSKLCIPAGRTKSAKEAREQLKANNKMFLIPVDQPINRTCAATGISKRTLLRIKKQVNSESPDPSSSSTSTCDPPRPSTPGKKRKPSKKKINLGSVDLVALRNIINSFKDRKEIPTLKKILDAAKKDLNFPGERTTLRIILKDQLGYKFKKCKNARSGLIKKPDNAASGARYGDSEMSVIEEFVVDAPPTTQAPQYLIHPPTAHPPMPIQDIHTLAGAGGSDGPVPVWSPYSYCQTHETAHVCN